MGKRQKIKKKKGWLYVIIFWVLMNENKCCCPLKIVKIDLQSEKFYLKLLTKLHKWLFFEYHWTKTLTVTMGPSFKMLPKKFELIFYKENYSKDDMLKGSQNQSLYIFSNKTDRQTETDEWHFGRHVMKHHEPLFFLGVMKPSKF